MAIGNILGNIFGGGGTASSNRLQATQNQQSQESDDNQSAQIGAQIQAERKKTQAQIYQIQQETKTKVAEMFRESNLNRTKSADKLHQKWVQQMMA